MKTIIALALGLLVLVALGIWCFLARQKGVYRISAGGRVFKVRLILPPGDRYHTLPLSVGDRDRLTSSLSALDSDSPIRFRVTTRKYDFTNMIFDVEIISVNG